MSTKSIYQQQLQDKLNAWEHLKEGMESAWDELEVAIDKFTGFFK